MIVTRPLRRGAMLILSVCLVVWAASSAYAAQPARGSLTSVADAAGFIRGDANDDGEITLADAIHVVMYLFADGPTPLPSEDTGDANCDSKVDPLDIVYLVNYVLRGGPKPKCPS